MPSRARHDGVADQRAAGYAWSMFTLLALAVASPASCRVEDARYALRTAPHVTAWFRPVDSGADWPAGVAFATRFGDTGRTYWWLPWDGGTDGRRSFASTTDPTAPGWRPPSPDGGPRPLGNVEYVATDAVYDVLDAMPRRGDAAPAHILMPHFGRAMWRAAREEAPKQFFDLVGCSRTE